jgi:hypothetical protein
MRRPFGRACGPGRGRMLSLKSGPGRPGPAFLFLPGRGTRPGAWWWPSFAAPRTGVPQTAGSCDWRVRRARTAHARFPVAAATTPAPASTERGRAPAATNSRARPRATRNRRSPAVIRTSTALSLSSTAWLPSASATRRISPRRVSIMRTGPARSRRSLGAALARACSRGACPPLPLPAHSSPNSEAASAAPVGKSQDAARRHACAAGLATGTGGAALPNRAERFRIADIILTVPGLGAGAGSRARLLMPAQTRLKVRRTGNAKSHIDRSFFCGRPAGRADRGRTPSNLTRDHVPRSRIFREGSKGEEHRKRGRAQACPRTIAKRVSPAARRRALISLP